MYKHDSECANEWVSDSYAFFGYSFPSLGLPCSAFMSWFFVLSYYTLSCYFFFSLRSSFFLMRDRKGIESEGRQGEKELEGAERGKTVIKIKCVTKESIFNKREKLKSKWKYREERKQRRHELEPLEELYKGIEFVQRCRRKHQKSAENLNMGRKKTSVESSTTFIFRVENIMSVSKNFYVQHPPTIHKFYQQDQRKDSQTLHWASAPAWLPRAPHCSSDGTM